jgi:hypothetical protein
MSYGIKAKRPVPEIRNAEQPEMSGIPDPKRALPPCGGIPSFAFPE